MRLGIIPPYRAGVAADPEWVTRFARAAEHAGFESIYAVEHVVVPAGHAERYPYATSGRMPLTDDCPIPDPLDLLAFVGARTERIVLATGILVGPHHHPLVLAKRVATIDALTGGRMRLGVGVGWMREELEATGVDFSTRGRRLDELIDAMRVAWSDDEPTFAGEFFRFERAVCRPRPSRPGGVPIHVGGHSAAAARRAGRRGDGFQPLGLDGDALGERLAEMRRAAVDAGRDPDAIELTLGAGLATFDRERLERLVEAGADRVLLSAAASDLSEIEDQMGAAATVAATAGATS